jgi:hypothetical protein
LFPKKKRERKTQAAYKREGEIEEMEKKKR